MKVKYFSIILLQVSSSEKLNQVYATVLKKMCSVFTIGRLEEVLVSSLRQNILRGCRCSNMYFYAIFSYLDGIELTHFCQIESTSKAGGTYSQNEDTSVNCKKLLNPCYLSLCPLLPSFMVSKVFNFI